MASEMLAGKVAIITGGARGIGAGGCRVFCSEGARVVIADIDRENGESLAGELVSAGHDAIFMETDVAVTESVRACIAATIGHFGHIDILYNNAGWGDPKPFYECSEDEWERTLGINLRGTFLCSKYAVREMLKRGSGAIVNTGSGHSEATIGGLAVYAASKGGVLMLTRGMALDLARTGIRVNCILPGAIRSTAGGMDPEELEAMYDEMKDDQPVGRIGEPEEIAHVAVFLASEAASFVTGAAFAVDGGLLARLTSMPDPRSDDA